MFTIREGHLEPFARQAMSRFEARALKHLRDDLPGPTTAMTDDQLRQVIRTGLGQARSHGLLSEREAVGFIDAVVLLGPGFEDAPENGWARQILKDRKLSPDEKARWLAMTAAEQHSSRHPRGDRA